MPQTPASCNEKLFHEIHSKYRIRVFETAFRITHCPHRSGDITQQVFMNLWVQKTKLHLIQNMGAYIAILARNHSISDLRDRKRLRRHSERAASKQSFSFELPAELDLREAERFLNLAVQQLPQQRKKVFLLSRIEGWKRKEIADSLRISEDTVKGTLRHAQKFVDDFMRETLY